MCSASTADSPAQADRSACQPVTCS
jgi:hypothetical protein